MFKRKYAVWAIIRKLNNDSVTTCSLNNLHESKKLFLIVLTAKEQSANDINRINMGQRLVHTKTTVSRHLIYGSIPANMEMFIYLRSLGKIRFFTGRAHTHQSIELLSGIGT